MSVTIADCKKLLEEAAAIRERVRVEVSLLRKAATIRSARVVLQNAEQEIYWREVASLPIFDLVANDLATQPEGEDYGMFVRHVLERARGAVNQHAAQHGGEPVLRTPL